MRHVVSGAAGFLGSHLVDRLLSRGDEVVGFDNLATGSRDNLRAALRHPRFTLVEHDITEPFVVGGAVDRVWNLASPASPPHYQRLRVETLRAGSDGTRRMLDLARKKGARFLQTSTSEVYGDPLVSPQAEEYWGNVNPIGERSMYDESKRFAEALVMAYHRAYRVDTRIVRIFNTYGPRMALHDGRVVPNFVAQALRGDALTVYGTGTQTRSFCYVDDELDGIERLMASSYALPMNIGNPREMTILEFADVVRKVSGKELPIVFRPKLEDDPMQRRPDITKARTILGWEPRTSLEDGMRVTYESFSKEHTAA